MTDETQERTAASELLGIYLRDHRAGAAAGLQLVRRCRRHANSGQLEAMLAWLEAEIEQDRRTLDSIMDGLDVKRSAVKAAVGVAAERAGRLKLNGHLWKRSPLSTLLELEALAAAIYTKRNLWESLAAVAERSAVGSAQQLGELIDRATIQLDRVQAHHNDAACHAFDAVATGHIDEARSPGASTQHSTAPTGQSMASEPPDEITDPPSEAAETWR